MSSTSPWEIKAILCDPKTWEIFDEIRIQPGPVIRYWLECGLFLNDDLSHDPRAAYLVVVHLPSGNMRSMPIVRDNGKFKARHNGELITLEASVKVLKGEVTEWLREQNGRSRRGKRTSTTQENAV